MYHAVEIKHLASRSDDDPALTLDDRARVVTELHFGGESYVFLRNGTPEEGDSFVAPLFASGSPVEAAGEWYELMVDVDQHCGRVTIHLRVPVGSPWQIIKTFPLPPSNALLPTHGLALHVHDALPGAAQSPPVYFDNIYLYARQPGACVN